METPIILVFYIEVGHLDAADVTSYIGAVQNQLKKESENSEARDFIRYIIPTRGESHSRIECINPKLVGEDEYAKIVTAMSKLEAAMAELEKERATKEEPELPPAHSDR